MQTSLTTFSSSMSEQFAALANSVGEIQQRLINLEENMTLSSMVRIIAFSLLLASSRYSVIQPRLLMKNVHFSNRQRLKVS